MPIISMIVAYTLPDRVIGINNTLPWKLPSDLAHFKKMTTGCPILMGRNTWESLGRPLPNRRNIVITRNADYIADGAEIALSLEQAIALCQTETRIFIIGGEQIYAQSLAIADELIATEIHTTISGDAFFPDLPKDDWTLAERSITHTENDLSFEFVTYSKRTKTL